MKGLQKIGDVADRYDVTGRTLRYYEEIGLLDSVRPPFTQQRFYTAAAVARLEQILLLRKLDLPVKEIQAIFASKDLRVAVDAFARKLQSLEAEIGRLDHLRSVVASFLQVLQEQGYDTSASLRLLQEQSTLLAAPYKVKEVPPAMTTKLDHVRMIELKPMTVACYQVESPTPEEDAWAVMLRWVEEKGLKDLATTRFFGFNNPEPSRGRPEHGYEAWISVPEGTEPSGAVQIKAFAGGLYAVAPTYLYEIGERWEALFNWVQQSTEYDWVNGGRWLEETVSPEKSPTPPEKLQLDLYLPIRRA